jgi:hypothetical protein
LARCKVGRRLDWLRGSKLGEHRAALADSSAGRPGRVRVRGLEGRQTLLRAACTMSADGRLGRKWWCGGDSDGDRQQRSSPQAAVGGSGQRRSVRLKPGALISAFCKEAREA